MSLLPRAPLATGALARAPTTLDGGRLAVARAVWLVLVALTLALFVAGALARFQELQSVCAGANCATARLAPEEALALQRRGLPLPLYALIFLGLEAGFALAFAAIGLVIFWRKSDDWLALLVALTLVTFGAMIPPPLRTLDAVAPHWRLPVHLVQVVGYGSFFSFFYLFPDGRFVPRWTRAGPPLFAAWGIAWLLAPGANLFSWPLHLGVLVLLLVFASGAVAQLYRYIRVSSQVQRQQTKWVVLGFLGATAGIVAFLAPALLFPVLREPGLARVLYQTFGIPFFALSLVLIPVSIALSILRYRLWDIDLLMNRTLVYGALTAALALIYAAGVAVLQHLFRSLTGQSSPVAIVGSTLAIVALFNPLQHRIQMTIDRRFYRNRYDAAQAIAAFGAALRDDVNLERLTEQMLQVVAETMQPARVSLWLRVPRGGVARTGAGPGREGGRDE